MSCSEFHSKLNNFRSYEKYCDVNINVQGQNFPCHRVVLAASSEYFDAMFGGCFKEKDAQEVTLQEIDVKTFQNVITFMYAKAEFKITGGDIFNLLRASSFLGIRSMEKHCVEFILKNLSLIQDLIDIFILACSMNMTNLMEALSLHIFKNFPRFYKNERFLVMPYNDLKLILDKWVRDKLPFKRENLLLDLLLRWVHYSPEERRKYFKELVETVDIERISAKYIMFMLKYFKNLIEVSAFNKTSEKDVASMMKESTSASNSSFGFQDSMNRFLLKKKIVEYFTINERFLGSSSDEMPLPFVAPKFYKSELNLNVYVEYTGINCTIRDENGDSIHKRLKDAKIFSANKCKPEWTLSGKTTAFYRCSARRTVSRKPFDLMYCFEIFEDQTDYSKSRQSFCTYSSIDMNLPSNILTPPPVTLKSYLGTTGFDTCAAHYGIILRNQHELYHYNCEVDKWSTLPEVPFEYYFMLFYPRLAVDDNLIYLVGGDENENGIVALDNRTASWMNLGINSNIRPYDFLRYTRHSCTLNGKLYASTGSELAAFDLKAQRWENLRHPEISSHTFLIAYEDMLWVFSQYSNFPKNYQIATYNPISQDWHTDEWLMNKAIEAHVDELKESSKPGNYIFDNDIKEVIVFKS